jgi:tetrahydromethanopterin:alpha-L-glutamate ligase
MSPSDRLEAARQAASGPRIALAIDIYDWHARILTAAFARAGANAVPVRLSRCGFDTRRRSGLVIPGFGPDLPDAMLVRAVGSGSFESVTLRLDVLHSLGALGVPVLNSARTVEICVDKAATSFVLARNAIPTPPTWTVQSVEAAHRIARRETLRGPLVVKPLFGAQGYGLKLIRREDDLPSFDTAAGVYYLQQFVAVERDGFSDIRIFVSDGKVIAAMTRRAKHWITNLKLGAQPEWLVPDAPMIDLALRATAAVGAVFAGVDMIRDAAGDLQVLEVNSMPGWRGLQKVAPFSIADLIAKQVLMRIPKGRAEAGR